MKKLFAVLFLMIFLATSTLSYAETQPSVPEREKPSSTAIMFDLVITRPLGLVALALGTGVFVIGLPFSVPTRSVKVTARRLIADPFNFTFQRPVGELDEFDYDNGV
ncbi:MAG: hypothetical protein HYS21_09320 [Deltaproteobacteria bacterium]|nr:hypothetical protein [Deltaproteobacteria bacterium]